MTILNCHTRQAFLFKKFSSFVGLFLSFQDISMSTKMPKMELESEFQLILLGKHWFGYLAGLETPVS